MTKRVPQQRLDPFHPDVLSIQTLRKARVQRRVRVLTDQDGRVFAGLDAGERADGPAERGFHAARYGVAAGRRVAVLELSPSGAGYLGLCGDGVLGDAEFEASLSDGLADGVVVPHARTVRDGMLP